MLLNRRQALGAGGLACAAATLWAVGGNTAAPRYAFTLTDGAGGARSSATPVSVGEVGEIR